MKLKRLAALVLAGMLCFSTVTGCGMNSEETIATLGEQKISVGMANFFCKYQKVMMDDMYGAYFGENMWSMDMSGTGTTMEDQVKDSVMTSLHELYTVKEHAEEYHIELTDDEKQKIKDAAEAFIADNTEEALKEMSATKEIVEELLSLYTLQWKTYEAVIVDTDREVSAEEANMRGYTLISVSTAGKYDDDGTYTEYTDEEAAAIKEEVEKAKLALISETLETIAEQYDYNIQTGAYKKEDSSLDATLLAAMDALQEGETSEVVETENTLYIVRIDSECDEEATEENRLSIIAEREYALYEETIANWQEEDDWKVDKKLLEDIEFHHILTQTAQTEEDTAEVK